MFIYQAVQISDHYFVDPDIETRDAETPARAQFRNGSMVNVMFQQSTDATYRAKIASVVTTPEFLRSCIELTVRRVKCILASTDVASCVVVG